MIRYFSSYMRTCRKCLKVFKSKFKTGKICDDCKLNRHDLKTGLKERLTNYITKQEERHKKTIDM